MNFRETQIKKNVFLRQFKENNKNCLNITHSLRKDVRPIRKIELFFLKFHKLLFLISG